MKPHKGFSLLEILVAFSIMAVALTIVLRIFGSGVNAAVVSEEYSIAVQIAESLMARVGVETPLEAGEINGVEADLYEWQVRISPVIAPQAPLQKFKSQQEDTENTPSIQLFNVRVQVVWGDEEIKQRSLVLNSLKLAQQVEAEAEL
jgi:general secretion pathway protein I